MTPKKGILVHPDEFTKKRIDSCVTLGIDTLGIHPEGGANAKNTLAALVRRTKAEDFRYLADYALSRGVKIEYEMHAASYLLDRELFSSHPEYFREDEYGKRNPDVNLCVSSEDALTIVSENAARLALSLYGSTNRFFFWLDDVRKKKCNCERCRRLSISDQQLIFQNAVLRGIRSVIPRATVAYLAYTDSMEVPKVTAPLEGIFLEYAPFEKYVSRQDAALVAKEHGLISPLLSFFGKEDSKVLEYWLDNSLFSGWKKPPKKFTADGESIKKDVKEYAELGFSEISTFACFLGDDYEELYGEADISPLADAFRI